MVDGLFSNLLGTGVDHEFGLDLDFVGGGDVGPLARPGK